MPFENLDIWWGVPIVLDERAIVAKVLRGRGGFCYELNAAFAWLLRALGYEVTLLEARVASDGGGFGRPFDHLALRVDMDTPWLADVGFGECFVEPLPLDSDAVSAQRGTEYRLRTGRSGRVLEQRRPGEAWDPQYELRPEPRELADFEPGCTYHQTSPESKFTQRPLCTRLDGGVRVTLHRDRLVRGEESTPVGSPGEWAARLAEWFGM